MTTGRGEVGLRRLPGVAILDLRGEINARAEAALTAAEQALAGEPADILLNFSDADYINSFGIALIVGLLARARAAGRRLLACGLSPHYVKLFAITRLSDFIPVHGDEAGALAALAGPGAAVVQPRAQ
jgi:anti-sigma B factor antagonist